MAASLVIDRRGGQRDAGEFAWEFSNFLLFCGAGGISWGVRDLFVRQATKHC